MSLNDLIWRDGRRLSAWRVAVALALTSSVGVLGFVSVQDWAEAQGVENEDPWFAGYVDATATPTFAFEDIEATAARDIVLSFIVADPDNPCTPTWGTAYDLDEAAVELDLDRRLARLEQLGADLSISFGGLLNDELATACTNPTELVRAYDRVITRYDVSTIDLDIEGENLTDSVVGQRRAEAIATLQEAKRAEGVDLAVWMTLPVLPSGLTEDGTTAVQQMIEAGVDLAGINVMTMNYGQSRGEDESMGAASISALQSTHRQLGIMYELAEIELSDGTLWRKIGATPMIGQNDLVEDVFTLDDAEELNAFAVENGVGRMSMWSLNRDVQCGPNYVDLTRVSDACSGFPQGETSYADVLATGFTGRLDSVAGIVTTPEPRDPADFIDDPETSPYPIWDEENAYLTGSKVVWFRNVYEAKWWTRGDLPDNPVLNEWETPWTLIGPVLDGEEPAEIPTLPYGVYPEWEGPTVYDKGERVLFDGTPYEAKWWNQGDSPEAYAADPDSSPWTPVRLEEIEEILSDLPEDDTPDSTE
ncbi:MAG: chitinase [Actinobacteria bacterium]|nr:chitinase [Actinomycetota bacterium]MBU1610057.1 chitinase [Actinomycetota bacterium]MBU2315575.1 chitinase [Actinomycetota bacterium]MBU2385375.1 chitinase [Actinomycetota bacterium]